VTLKEKSLGETHQDPLPGLYKKKVTTFWQTNAKSYGNRLNFQAYEGQFHGKISIPTFLGKPPCVMWIVGPETLTSLSGCFQE